MTARLIPHSREAEGRLLRSALVCAVVLHALALLLPVRTAGTAPKAPRKVPRLVVTPLEIPPPRIEKPVVTEPLSIVRRVPLPAAEPAVEELEPVYEKPVILDEMVEGEPLDELPLARAVPPPPRIVDAGVKGLVLPVRLPGGEEPAFPSIAKTAGIEGTVMITAIIDEEGYVEEAQVVRAPNPDLGFSEAALAAVTTWRYRPGEMHERRVAVRLTVWVEFTLRR